MCCVHLAVLGAVGGDLASTSGFCSALEQLSHSVALLLSLLAAASSVLAIECHTDLESERTDFLEVHICKSLSVSGHCEQL